MTGTPEAPTSVGEQQKTDGSGDGVASAVASAPGSTLQEKAKRHLWMHFTRLSGYDDVEVPVITRGSAFSPTGPMPIPALSSWPRESPLSRPAT
jgi:hypothetical protein